MSEQGFRAVVRGRVQGVGFRAAIRRQAQQLGLRGSAYNHADGSVIVIAAGAPAAIAALQAWLAVGPAVARVDSVSVAAVDPAGVAAGFDFGWTSA